MGGPLHRFRWILREVIAGLRVGASLLAILASLAAVVGAVILSWSHAPEGVRLRLYVQANRPIPAAARLSGDDLDTRLGWLDESLRPFTTVNSIDGWYAQEHLAKGTPLALAQVAPSPPVVVDPGSSVAPVKVPSAETAHLVPGMTLAFATQNNQLPDPSREACKNETCGLTLLSILPASAKGEEQTLLVVVPSTFAADVMTLSDGVWRPVVLSQGGR